MKDSKFKISIALSELDEWSLPEEEMEKIFGGGAPDIYCFDSSGYYLGSIENSKDIIRIYNMVDYDKVIDAGAGFKQVSSVVDSKSYPLGTIRDVSIIPTTILIRGVETPVVLTRLEIDPNGDYTEEIHNFYSYNAPKVEWGRLETANPDEYSDYITTINHKSVCTVGEHLLPPGYEAKRLEHNHPEQNGPSTSDMGFPYKPIFENSSFYIFTTSGGSVPYTPDAYTDKAKEERAKK